MPRIKKTGQFEFPEIQTKRKKVLSSTSKSIYKSYLNKLVSSGFKTVKDLTEKPEAVIKAIQTVFPDKQKQKTVLFAVFYVLTDTEFCNGPNAYYWYLQSLKEDDDPTKKVEEINQQ